MTDSKQRSVLDFESFVIGMARFHQPDMDAACEKQVFIPEADYKALGSPEQITITIEVGDLLNEDEPDVTEIRTWDGEIVRVDPDLIGDGEGPYER